MALTYDTVVKAVTAARDYALGQFETAHTSLTTTLAAPLPVGSTDDEKKQRAADVARAQGQMAAAVQQAAQMEAMLSEARGRAGYEAVVLLMEKTQAAAADAMDKLKLATNLGANPADQQRIALLTNLLLALAELSPVPIWQKTPPPGGNSA